jgi:outer membrane murein-binding lipoprotein Lpp
LVALHYDHRAFITNIALGLPLPLLRPGSFVVCDFVSCVKARSIAAQVQKLGADLAKLKADRDAIAALADDAARRAATIRLALATMTVVIENAEQALPSSNLTRLRGNIDAVGGFMVAVNGERYTEAVVDAVRFAESQGVSVAMSANALRFIAAAGTIAQANDDASMTKAVDMLVAPPNRFLRKRDPKSGWYFMLNSYFGVAYAREQACVTLRGCSETASVGGAYVPVTIDIGRPVKWGFVASASLSIQAIDLGAIASWRVTQAEQTADAVRAEPTVGFTQVFAPGAHIVLGFKGPIAWGVGVAASPRLRSLVDTTKNTPRNGVRVFSTWFAMDVPLFP